MPDLPIQTRSVVNSVVNADSLPPICVVVPNFNGGATLETTLKSLIDQNYPKLEILVVDGASTDKSVEIIRRYDPHIAWWVSEKDHGQADAINKGFARAKGEIVNWLCSDDILLPGALETVGRVFAAEPDTDVVVGVTIEYYATRKRKRVWFPSEKEISMLPINAPFGQPSCFYRKRLLETRATPLDATYHYAMDIELWTHFNSIGVRWRIINQELSYCLQSGDNKTQTGGERITRELERLYRSYVHERIPLTFWHRRLRYPLERIRHNHRGLAFGLIYYPYQCAIIALLSPFYGFKRVKFMNWADFG